MYIFWQICKSCLVCSLRGEGRHFLIWLEWVCATEQGMGLRFLSLEGMQFTVPIYRSAFNSWVSLSNESLEQNCTVMQCLRRVLAVGCLHLYGVTFKKKCNNPLSPSIQIQILQTDLHTFPLRISCENLIKYQGIFSFVIIFYILTTLSLDNVWTLLGENCCWSLLGLKGLILFIIQCC